ncbi:MAG TPA: maleylpyruvate isomerase N-terminal domain-containing protein [Mycobacteriales bacterium]|nr:maleylpyruvate isomerase N-terminal domain-containing protein [Mycobacteriales bacterium]
MVAHLAGNARSHIRMLDGAARGVVTDQYPDGAGGREAEIAELAADPASAVSALHDSCGELEQLWRSLGGVAWTCPVRPLDADPVPAGVLAWARWREVCVFVGPQPRTPVAGELDELVLWVLGRSAGTGLRTSSGALPDLPEWR